MVSSKEIIPRDLPHTNKYYPLTATQNGFWLALEMNPDSLSYSDTQAILFKGTLNLHQWEECINEMIRRNEILRTTFHLKDGKPMQRVEEPFKFKVDYFDLRAETDKKNKVQETKNALSKKIWKLDQLPLFSFSIIHVEDDLFWIFFNFNHLIFDRYGFCVFESGLSQLYNHYPDFSSTKEPEIQYVDYVLWEQEQDLEQKEHAIDFYRAYLQNNESINFNFARKNISEISSNKAEILYYELPPDAEKKITLFAKQNNVSKFVFMLSTFFLLISRHNAGEEITLGLPVVNRNHAKLLKMLGLFLNTSLISQKINPDLTFIDFMKEIEKNLSSIREYESFPYNEIVRNLKPKHNIKRNPYFDILFNYIPKRLIRPWKLNQIEQMSEDFDTIETEILLTWYIFEIKDTLLLGCKSPLDLLDHKSLNILFWQFHALFEQIIHDPHKKLSSYSLLFPETIDEHHREMSASGIQIADYFGYTFHANQVKLQQPADTIVETDYPLVASTIRDTAISHPCHTAVCANDKTWSYSDLIQTAESIAAKLLLNKIERGDVAAIHGERSFGLYAAVIGVWMAGGTILLIDHTHPDEYKKTLIHESKAKWLVAVQSEEKIEEGISKLFPSASLLKVDPEAVLKNSQNNIPFPEISPYDPAYIFFTSGTTGVPKGIKGTQRGLSHFLNWQKAQFGIGPEDKCAQITNLSFDVVMREIFTPLISGAALYIPSLNQGLESGNFLQWLQTQKITLLHIVPTLADILLSESSLYPPLNYLRWVFFAGEPLPSRLVNKWRSAFPSSGRIVNLYGPTETTLAKTFYVIPTDGVLEGIQPIGKPLPQTQIIIMNKDQELCGVNEAGEICIRTPYRTLGYINPEAKDHFRFFQNRFREDPKDLLYMTGDLGYMMHDGTVCICGRTDDQIKINGIRLNPGDIAGIIAKDPLVKQCVVIGKKSDDGKTKLVAYVVPKDQISQEELKDKILMNLRGKYPNYMIPYAIMQVAKIPVTARGKLDKKALPEPELSVPSERKTGKRPPLTDIQKELAAYWEKELKISEIGLDDNFFEIGGDSLAGMKMIIHVNDHYKVNIKLHNLVVNPTLEALAGFIENGTKEKLKIKMTIEELSKFVELPRLEQKGIPSKSENLAEKILITGVTGFFGSYLLDELLDTFPQAKFYCLVRAKNDLEGMEKMTHTFKQYKLKNIELLKDRVIPVLGDLSKPTLGLSNDQFQTLCNEIDLIYHSGALVNFIYNFQQLKPSNVDGTKIIIAMAARGKLKPIHYISTAGIYPSSASSEQSTITDDSSIGELQENVVGGYAQTKWVADKIMQEARTMGIPITIYRPGRISWDTETGIWQENDAIFRFIYGCIQLGSFPGLSISLDLNPVNTVAKMVADISLRKDCAGKNYNIVNPDQIAIYKLVDYLNEMGVSVNIIPYADWRKKLNQAYKTQQNNVLLPLFDLFEESLEDMPRLKYNRNFVCSNVLNAISGTDVSFPNPDFAFFHSFMSHFFEDLQKVS